MDYKTIKKLYVRNVNGKLEWATKRTATHWTYINVYLTDLSSTEFDGVYSMDNNEYAHELDSAYWELVQRDWVCGDAFNWAKVY